MPEDTDEMNIKLINTYLGVKGDIRVGGTAEAFYNVEYGFENDPSDIIWNLVVPKAGETLTAAGESFLDA